MKSANKISIQGTVKGLFYSQFVNENAEKLKLRGYFRVLDDGKVEI